jgi:hypothetical protein
MSLLLLLLLLLLHFKSQSSSSFDYAASFISEEATAAANGLSQKPTYIFFQPFPFEQPCKPSTSFHPFRVARCENRK